MNVPRSVRTAQLQQQQAAALVALLDDGSMPLPRYTPDLRGVPVIGAGAGATWWTQPANEKAWRALHDPRLQPMQSPSPLPRSPAGGHTEAR